MNFKAGDKVQVRMDNIWVDAIVNHKNEKGKTIAYDVEFIKPFSDSEGYSIEGTLAYWDAGPTNEIRKG